GDATAAIPTEPTAASVPGIRRPLEDARLAAGEREARLQDRRWSGERSAPNGLTIGAMAVVDHQRRLRDRVPQPSALTPAHEWKCNHAPGLLPPAYRPLEAPSRLPSASSPCSMPVTRRDAAP